MRNSSMGYDGKSRFIWKHFSEMPESEKEVIRCLPSYQSPYPSEEEQAEIDAEYESLPDIKKVEIEQNYYDEITNYINMTDSSPLGLQKFYNICHFDINKIQYFCNHIHKISNQVEYLAWVLKEAMQYRATEEYDGLYRQGGDNFVQQIEIEWRYRKSLLEKEINPAQESGEKRIEPIQWIGTKEQFAAMINVLEEAQVITSEKKFEKFKQHFQPKDNSEWGDLSGKAVKLYQAEKDGNPRKKVKALETSIKSALK